MSADLSSLGAALPPVSGAALPLEVRNGTKAQKEAYSAALGFERMLLGELTQSMMATAQTDGSSSSDDSSSSDSSSSDSTGADAATSMYQQMLPEQLADSVTSAGGIGLAQQLYKSLGGTTK